VTPGVCRLRLRKRKRLRRRNQSRNVLLHASTSCNTPQLKLIINPVCPLGVRAGLPLLLQLRPIDPPANGIDKLYEQKCWPSARDAAAVLGQNGHSDAKSCSTTSCGDAVLQDWGGAYFCFVEHQNARENTNARENKRCGTCPWGSWLFRRSSSEAKASRSAGLQAR
jgi:hypothetical protein